MPKKRKPLGPPPDLQETLASCAKCATYGARAVAEKKFSSSVSREWVANVRLMQANIKIREGLEEMATLKNLVARMEAAQRGAQKNEIESRYTSSDEVHEYAAPDEEAN